MRRAGLLQFIKFPDLAIRHDSEDIAFKAVLPIRPLAGAHFDKALRQAFFEIILFRLNHA